MRSKKKSIAVLSAMLALVLAVQAFAFTAAKLGDSKAEDSVKAGVTANCLESPPVYDSLKQRAVDQEKARQAGIDQAAASAAAP